MRPVSSVHLASLGIIVFMGAAHASEPTEVLSTHERARDWRLGAYIGAYAGLDATAGLSSGGLGSLGGLGIVSPTVGTGLEARLGDRWWLLADLSGSARLQGQDRGNAWSLGGDVGGRYELNPDDRVTVSFAGRVGASGGRFEQCGLAGESSCVKGSTLGLHLDVDLAVAVRLIEGLALRVASTFLEARWTEVRLADAEDQSELDIGATLRPSLGLVVSF